MHVSKFKNEMQYLGVWLIFAWSKAGYISTHFMKGEAAIEPFQQPPGLSHVFC